MPTIRVSTWEECEEKLELVRHKVGGDDCLFRGQEIASWSLQTTLDRTPESSKLVHEYYSLIRQVKPQIETFTELEWNWDVAPNEDFCTYDKFSVALTQGKVPCYSYLIYLRHHGFPSPLLDWTRSPQIAAFFAFRRPSNEDVSIYMFVERPHRIKSRSSDWPSIYSFGPNIKSHRRHFLQQSTYTLCVQFAGLWNFAAYEDVFSNSPERDRQDFLWKFVIPSSERPKVLALLDDYNLNAFSLFGTEESLMETLATRSIELRAWRRRTAQAGVQPAATKTAD